jgi:hypothetical protein
MVWVRHVARMGKREIHTRFLWGKLKERDHSENLNLEGRIILKWTFGK